MVLAEVLPGAVNYTAYIQEIPQLIAKDVYVNLVNIILYSIGMVIYAILVWHFYRQLARRNLFEDKYEEGEGKDGLIKRIWHGFLFMFRYVFIFPLISFIWFLVLGALLLFLSKRGDISQVLLMSMTIIAAARMTAYYNEDLSKDVSKLIPFALLGVFIVDPTYFSLEKTLQNFGQLPSFLHIILQYLLYLIFLEFALRIVHRIKLAFFPS